MTTVVRYRAAPIGALRAEDASRKDRAVRIGRSRGRGSPKYSLRKLQARRVARPRRAFRSPRRGGTIQVLVRGDRGRAGRRGIADGRELLQWPRLRRAAELVSRRLRDS